jgi:predicted flap endonuclease-1-like 5' DNA nuclease
MTDLTTIEGIGEAYSGQLSAAGISTTEDLLEKAATPIGRQAVEEETGISGKLVLRWANMADLFRIKGVSEEYADLLEACGVDTVPELAQRNPGNLFQALLQTNEEKQLVRGTPGESQVASWVSEAKELPRILTY